MISGHLQEKKGRYYMVLSLKNGEGKWKPKWISTGLPVKGNKKRAEVILRETIVKYEALEAQELGQASRILFCDFMLNWLEIIRSSVEATTFTSYRNIVKNRIVPYFRELGVTLAEVEQQPRFIQSYYTYLMVERGNKATTVRRHHANIRKALQYALKTDMISTNPADKVEKPKQLPYIAKYYDDESLNQLFEKARDTRLYLPILVTAFYGLRRSEVLGLRWSAIDFKNKSISICHTVGQAEDDEGKRYLVQKDRTKNKSSFRTLPLISQVEEALLIKKNQDEEYRRVCKRSYCKEFSEYIFVDELGRLMNPEYLSKSFPNFLEKHGLKRIRFHDLRHSCASLLLKNGVSMKAIQEWLGHSNFSTTANLYAHLDFDSKKESAQVVGNVLLQISKEQPEADKKENEVAPAQTA